MAQTSVDFANSKPGGIYFTRGFDQEAARWPAKKSVTSETSDTEQVVLCSELSTPLQHGTVASDGSK